MSSRTETVWRRLRTGRPERLAVYRWQRSGRRNAGSVALASCASSTALMMRATTVSSDKAVTQNSSVPDSLMVPAKTESPGFLSTGMLSPVTGDWSTVPAPPVTVPSSGMRSPGRTLIVAFNVTFLTVRHSMFRFHPGFRLSAGSGREDCGWRCAPCRPSGPRSVRQWHITP